MVLYALRIDFCDLSADAERHQKLQDKLVTLAGFVGKISSGIGEVDASVRLSGDQAKFLQLAHALRNGHMAHAESGRKISGSALAGLSNQVFDELDVVFRDFPTVVLSGPLKSVRRHGGILPHPSGVGQSLRLRPRSKRVERVNPRRFSANTCRARLRTDSPMQRKVIIIGGGLAGLACARTLSEAGVPFQLLEASDRVGGRLKTDSDGAFLFDRGFQVHFTAYPNAGRLLDNSALKAKAFLPGALITQGSAPLLIDQGRTPKKLIQTALSPLLGLADKLEVLRWTSTLKGKSTTNLFSEADRSARELLEEKFSEDFIHKFAIPFFAGVFLDRSLNVSANRLQWVWKMLAEGDTVLPLEGIEAVARGVAQGITAGSVRTHAPVDSLSRAGGKWQVHLRSSEVLEAEVVVIATDVATASNLARAKFDTEMFGSTCLYFEAPDEPLTEPYLLLNGTKNPGLVNHVAPLTKVQPGYRLASGRGALVSVNILGVSKESDESLAASAKAEIAPWLPEARSNEWRFLRAYRIPNAQLAHRPGYAKRQPKMVYDDNGLLLAGEYVQNSSIDGAVESGVRAAKRALERV